MTENDTASKQNNLEVGVEAQAPDERRSRSESNSTGPLLRNRLYHNPEDGKTIGNKIFRGEGSIIMWFLVVCVPVFYLCLFFGVIPIGNREHTTDSGRVINGYWVFICVVNPINMAIISFINAALFLACMGVQRPFRVHPLIVLSAFVFQIALWIVILPFVGTFPFFGGCALALSYLVTFSAIYIFETQRIKREFNEKNTESDMYLSQFQSSFFKYIKIIIAFYVFFCILVLYIYGYSRLGSGAGQKLLPFAMTIGIFIFRKIMLSLTDAFPIEIAMFISGFWVENAYDMFQVMAYRSVKDPVNYVTIWLTNVLSILANLIFLTDAWFVFRVKIKEFLTNFFHGHPSRPLMAQIEMEEVEDERGHSNNKPGYHRRQARFLSLKLLSKMIAALFHVAIAPLLRFGTNKSLFPFNSDTYQQFINSIIFSFSNFGFLLFTGVLIFLYIRFAHRTLLSQVYMIFNNISKDRTFNGCVIALAVHNGILAILMMMYFNQIWYASADDADQPLE